jgi:putative addiction module CopG family antidote
MNIALPESQEPVVRRRVEEGGYASAEEYVRDLILADQDSKDDEQLERLLLGGVKSGHSVEADEAFWEPRRRRRVNGA